MKRIDEIIKQHTGAIYNVVDIRAAMLQYGEELLAKAAENAKVECWDFERYSVDKESILDTEL